MTSDSKRSWLNMIRAGSSMTTEAWDEYYKPNLTWNHAWGSAPANITARKLMGIEPVGAAFSRFRISPQPGYLDSASIKLPTIRGEIVFALAREENLWEMTVSIPGNTEGELWLPAYLTNVTIDGVKSGAIREVRFAGESRKAYALKSGIFKIKASKH
jgi:hypothetical protein